MADTLSGPPANRKPTHWDDLATVPRVTLADGTIAEGMAALAYAWDVASQTFKTVNTLPVMKTAGFSLSSTGTVVAAVSSMRLKVFAVKLIVSAAISVNFRDGGVTALEGAQAVAANSGFVESVQPPAFLFGTSAGNSLDLVITGSGTAAGRVTYWDSDAT